MFLEFQKQILRFFSGIQNPVLNRIGEFFTMFGEELVPLAIAVLIFWCIDKKKGFSACLMLIFIANLNNFIKSLVRFPRPWVVDPSLSTLRKSTATGYSFPSGHSACATSFYPSVAISFKKKWIKIVAVVLSIAVPVSRMYLCCHWPMDVVCGSIVGLVSAFTLTNFFIKLADNREVCQKKLPIIGIIYYAIGFVLTVLLQLEKVDFTAYSDYTKSVALLGAMMFFYPIEQRNFNFSTKGTVKQKALRYAVGMVGAVFFMVVIKKILPYTPIFSYLRYTLVATWTCLYPLLGRKLNLFVAE